MEPVRNEIKENNKLIYYLILHILLFVNAFTGVFSKFASKEDFLSIKFCLFYAGIIGILGIYAIVWQQILKHIPLTTAFCNKGVGIIWGMLLGLLFFKEQIKINMVIGAVIVIIGVIIVVKSDAPNSNNEVNEEVRADEQ